MKNAFRLIAILIIALSVLVSKEVKALDISSSVILDRYTILSADSLEIANGYLLKNGKFHVLTSYVSNVKFYDSIMEFAEISGRPVMPADLFNGYKFQGVLPTWVRSRRTFWVGMVEYVIVAVKGKGDPNPVPSILEQPESDRVLAGDSAWFFVDAIPGNFSCQWYFKNKPIRGATDSWLEIENVTKANAGIYSVAVSLDGKRIMSQKALLTVVQPVSIKTQPKSRTVKARKNITLRVAVKGTGPFTYQWYWNDQPIANATRSFYTIKKAQASDSGSYSVLVGNGLTSVISNDAVITVHP